ncbi:MAG: hypothetical protein H0V01_08660 [Bacteroidetes bacterium]|nr:hypothetical protein [Bacteroidota bacterium]HET6244560.1 DUF6580 family putative transport protein [Bacteroidia bacterium]
MIKTITSPRFLFVAVLILVAALSRLLPHPPNFTPVAAIALFGGAYLSRKFALLIPIVAMLIADLFLGFHDTMWAVYLSLILITLIGLGLASRVKIVTVIGCSLVSSVLFFIVTNFAVWLGSPYYSQDISGLITCYISAIPFFNYTILGDLVYSGVLFTGFYLASLKFPKLAKAKA